MVDHDAQIALRIPRSPRLRAHVAQLWHWRGYEKPCMMERLMPNGETSLIVNLHEDVVRVYDPLTLRLETRLRGAVLVGAYARPSVIDAEEQRHVFGVQFRAGGAFALLGMPAGEVANQHVCADDLWRGIDLRERLLACRGDVEAIFDAAESLLLDRLRRDVHPAVEYAVGRLAANALPIGELVDETGLSARRFIQLFHDQVGLTPKLFGRLQRFQKAIRGGGPDWAATALECGYYDQSHLIRDFQEFAGMSPRAYASVAKVHPNHVPVVAG